MTPGPLGGCLVNRGAHVSIEVPQLHRKYIYISTYIRSHNQSKMATIIEASLSESSPQIQSLMVPFCSPTSTLKTMQDTVHALTKQVVLTAQSHDPTLATTTTTLLPILRGALPMFVGAQPLFASASCILAHCKKRKGKTQDVVVEWLGRRPTPDEDRRIVILDTIIATGDTIVRLCDEIQTLSGERRSVVILSCYAAPEALERIAMHPLVEMVVVAQKAERCDEAGYLVPYTHGDIGDKIYGQTERTEPMPVIADGQDGQAVWDGLDKLLVKNGGLWELTPDGMGIKREIQFKTFKEAWVRWMFMCEDAIAKR